MNIKNNKKVWIPVLIFFVFSLFSLNNCKSPNSPENMSAKIFISNECGADIDVYMDGVFQFSVEFLYYEVIEDVSGGTYEIVAKIKDTENVQSIATVVVDVSGDYWVTILCDASIKVINEYGETLNIYTNGSLQGELDHQESQVFTNVPYGKHILEASKASDNTLVASTTVDVVQQIEYAWTIK
jgi:hypothetical protein